MQIDCSKALSQLELSLAYFSPSLALSFGSTDLPNWFFIWTNNHYLLLVVLGKCSIFLLWFLLSSSTALLPLHTPQEIQHCHNLYPRTQHLSHHSFHLILVKSGDLLLLRILQDFLYIKNLRLRTNLVGGRGIEFIFDLRANGASCKHILKPTGAL